MSKIYSIKHKTYTCNIFQEETIIVDSTNNVDTTTYGPIMTHNNDVSLLCLTIYNISIYSKYIFNIDTNKHVLAHYISSNL